MKTAKEALTEARDLIFKGHCKGAYAKNAKGETVPVLDSDAVAFCAMGALYRANGKDLEGASDRLLGSYELRKAMENTILDYNDRNSKARVLAAFNRAIALTEKP